MLNICLHDFLRLYLTGMLGVDWESVSDVVPII
jgi:hypothetical protein